MCAGSGHSVKAKPCRAASRALTGCPCFPAMDTCGRRTRKPPAGARSKEVRSSKIQRQQHKKAFFASRGFPAYRHAADTMHTSLPRLTLHFLMCRMFIWSRQYTHQRHVGYNSAPQPIRTRHISDARIMHPRFCADACSFVQHCLRGPAYVSSIRCAYSLTAGKGRYPFEPRKGKRQKRQ